MQAGADTPQDDGRDVAFLGTHPVDELTGKKGDDGIEEGEHGGDSTIVVVIPMEIYRDVIGV